MDNKDFYKLHADFCKFMSNPKRIEIIFLLGKQEMCVEDIANKMNVKIPNVSQHLAVMRERGIVETRHEKTKVFYRISNPKTLQACLIMREVMLEQMKKNLSIFLNDENRT